MLRVVFMGSPEFAVTSLEKLAESEHEIVSVVSHPDKRRGRGGRLSPTPVKAAAMGLGLPVIEVESLQSSEFEKQLADLNPDLFVVVAFRILPPNILAIPSKGSVNLHASLLPAYRGAAPIHRAVMNGETKTGCTVFFLNREVDTGELIGRVETPIGPDETTGEVYNRLMEIGGDLLVDAVNRIDSGSVVSEPQDDTLATPAPKLFKEDAEIDFTRPAAAVHNKIRGLNPFPGAWTRYDNQKMTIYRSKIVPGVELKPGEFLFQDGKLLAGCGRDGIELLELQLPGRKRMSGVDFGNSFNVEGTLG